MRCRVVMLFMGLRLGHVILLRRIIKVIILISTWVTNRTTKTVDIELKLIIEAIYI